MPWCYLSKALVLCIGKGDHHVFAWPRGWLERDGRVLQGITILTSIILWRMNGIFLSSKSRIYPTLLSLYRREMYNSDENEALLQMLVTCMSTKHNRVTRPSNSGSFPCIREEGEFRLEAPEVSSAIFMENMRWFHENASDYLVQYRQLSPRRTTSM